MCRGEPAMIHLTIDIASNHCPAAGESALPHRTPLLASQDKSVQSSRTSVADPSGDRFELEPSDLVRVQKRVYCRHAIAILLGGPCHFDADEVETIDTPSVLRRHQVL